MNSDKHEKERANFSGRLGYVLATAGASVGLGNIWRFPYLAAKYGGGIFILIYLILTVTFGYTMALSETAVGRMTKKSPVGAFSAFGSSIMLKIGGWLNAIIPMIIVPYYAVIGGWVLKYLFEYLKGNGMALVADGYFNDFITGNVQPELFFIVFSILVFVIILGGVEKGIEGTAKIMMPLLIILAVCVTLYSMTRPGAIEGVKYILIPDFSRFSMMTIVAALGQMFFSLSIAMGILYTYGSYLKLDIDADQTTRQVEFFDTGIALMSAFMIIPAVFAFSGGDPANLDAGPSLMFITLPKVFASTSMANIIGVMFFFLVLFAALTSAIALMESCISTFQDELHWKRPACCLLMAVIMMIIGSLAATGYGVLSGVTVIGMPFLDFFDFLSNSVMMPIAAITTCLLILLKIGIDKIVAEIESSSPFRRKKVYVFFLKYLAIFCIGMIFLSSIASVLGIITI